MAFDYNNYYKLEYIESSGTQYIDTGIAESIYLTVDCKFYNPSPVNHYLFGGQQNSNYFLYNGLYSNNSLEYNYSEIKYTASTMVELQQDLGSDTLVSRINGVDYFSSFSTENTVSNTNFYIFACLNISGNIRLYDSTLRLYYFNIRNTEDQSFQRVFTPAKRKSDNVLGLYDEVNGVFYTNAGTGTFIEGPTILVIPSLVDLEKGITVPKRDINSLIDAVYNNEQLSYSGQDIICNSFFTGPSYSLASQPSAIGFTSQSSSADTVAIPVCNGKQTWTGTKNTFTVANSTCSGLDGESNPLDGAVRVAGLVEDIPAGVGVAKTVVGDNVYNAVWNDLVDCIEVPNNVNLEYGYAYSTDGTNFYKTKSYLDCGYIGIHSDTAGFIMGDKGKYSNQLKAAVAGFVLAYVDKEYPCGTPLTCTENGYLTKLKDEDIEKNPHLLVGTYWKNEPFEYWGFDKGITDNLLIEVKGRKWIKVK